MSPDECIAALDRALGRDGETITLRRTAGSPRNLVNLDVDCPAFVRSWRLREQPLVGTLAQFDFVVTISPTPILAAQWPGGTPPMAAGLPAALVWLPRKNDKLIVGGIVRSIEAVDPLAMNGTVVRIEMMTLG